MPRASASRKPQSAPAAFFAIVAEHGVAGIAARGHELAQDAHLALCALVADQEIGDAVVAQDG